LTGRRIFRLKIFLKKAVKKSDITKRKLWFNAFPHLPLTKKGKGLRMGKGIGKLNAWQIKLRGGVFLLEFRNLRPGRSVYFSKRIASKFPISVRWCFKNQTRITLNGARKVGIRPRNFY
jgi:ribosomal protein L16/L10AE